MDTNILSSITKLSTCMFNDSHISSQNKNPTKDEQKFLDRVHSYSPIDWYNRPSWLSPIRCASFGWISLGSGILQCQSCGNKIGGHMDQNLDITAGRLTYERLENLLVNGHNAWCIWKSCSVPEKFLRIDIQKEVQINFFERFKSMKFLTKVPVISREFYLDLNGERCKLFLNHLDETFMEKLCDEQKLLSKISLAICGWSLSETNKEQLICKFCGRSLGLWNYITLFKFKSNEVINLNQNINNEDITFDTDQINIINSSIITTFINEKSKDSTLESLSEEDVFDKFNKDLSYEKIKEADGCNDDNINVNQNNTGSNGGNDQDNNDNSNSNLIKDLTSIEIMPLKFAVDRLKRHLDDLNGKLQQEYKKRKIQSIKKTALHPIKEHQPWCIWVGGAIETSHDKSINLEIENIKTNTIDISTLKSSNENHFNESGDVRINNVSNGGNIVRSYMDIKDAKSQEDLPYMQLMKRIFYPVTLSNLKNEERIEEVHRVKNLLKL